MITWTESQNQYMNDNVCLVAVWSIENTVEQVQFDTGVILWVAAARQDGNREVAGSIPGSPRVSVEVSLARL